MNPQHDAAPHRPAAYCRPKSMTLPLRPACMRRTAATLLISACAGLPTSTPSAAGAAAAAARPRRRPLPCGHRRRTGGVGTSPPRQPPARRSDSRARRRSTPCGPTCGSTSTTQRAADLWQRVRNGFAIADLDSELVRKSRAVVREPARLRAAHDRARRPLPVPHRRGSRAARACPPSWRCCPSSKAPSIRRPCRRPRASGMWQFMPATGKDFDLKQNVFRDDRRDVLASTQRRARLPAAAARHVRRLASGAGRLQLGRRQCAARHRAQPAAPACRPTTPA